MSVQVAVSEAWGEEDIWDPASMGTVSVDVIRGAWPSEYLKSECACDQMPRDEIRPICGDFPALTQNARRARLWRRRLGRRAALSSWGQSPLLSRPLCVSCGSRPGWEVHGKLGAPACGQVPVPKARPHPLCKRRAA